MELSTTQWAAFLRPFVLFVVLCALYICRLAVQRVFPAGRLKSFLLTPIGRNRGR